MKYLVTGAAGFIGKHVVETLKEEHEVFELDLKLGHDIRNLSQLESIFRSETPDFIIHLAAVSRTPHAMEDPIYTYETNVIGSVNVLEAARRAKVKKVILASSNIVYAANTPYKTSKLAMEAAASMYDEFYNLPTLCLRFSNVYGENQHPGNVLASFSKSYKTKGYIEIYGDGEQTRNFTHVRDIADALELASIAEVRNDNIDIMHPRVWSLNEIAGFFPCRVHHSKERKGDVKILKMEGDTKARKLLNFETIYDLEDHIKEIYL